MFKRHVTEVSVDDFLVHVLGAQLALGELQKAQALLFELLRGVQGLCIRSGVGRVSKCRGQGQYM